MNYEKLYTTANRMLTNTLLALWLKGKGKEQAYLRKILTEKEPLFSEPVFQSVFPWELADITFEDTSKQLNLFDNEFVSALADETRTGSDYAFPLDRNPYLHQVKSWQNLMTNKTIVVTTGTGSGKTECFMIPVLQDLFRQLQSGKRHGVQAIFLYPLNALMKSQQQRIHAWCSALTPNVSYAIYNGDTAHYKSNIASAAEKREMEQATPQFIYREQIQENPPQVLFTNPTMLNYLLVRPEDQAIINKSQGTLRWILLDEVHSYSGSSASEMALQIRRVVDAFGVDIKDINFALTSATIGDTSDPKVAEKLKNFIHQLTGKLINDITVIDGRRIVPELDERIANSTLQKLNTLLRTNLSLDNLKKIREKLNDREGLSALDITAFMPENVSMQERLKVIDELGNDTVNLLTDGKSSALLPTRAHFFIRSVNGVYGCPNGDCQRDNEIRPAIGSMTTFQSKECNDCHQPQLEVVACPERI